MKRKIYIWALLAPLLLIASCKHDDLSMVKPNENLRPVADFIKNNYEMTLFSAALDKVGYSDQLNAEGPFTFLVPTDLAFNELGVYRASDFDKMNIDSLKRIIGYHILPRRLTLNDVPTNGVDIRYATLEGSSLYASLASTVPGGGSLVNELYFSGSDVVRKDVIVANGVLHVLNQVMKPNFDISTQQWLAQRPDYSVFVAGLKKFNLWEQLSGSGLFTVFAPDNQALEAVGITQETLNTMNANDYKGDLLFGSYLLYDRHFFISDAQVFSIINSDSRFMYFLKNDTHYMEYYAGKNYPSFKLSYTLKLRTGNTVYDQVVREVTSTIVGRNDNLCSNGLVHHLVEGLVRPEEAIKRQDINHE